MKKAISLFMSIIMIFSLSCFAFATENIPAEPIIEIYDFDGNLVENPDLENLWKYGGIFNADGTLVELTTRYGPAEYVNSVKTLQPGQYWTSYQYRVVQGTLLNGTGSCSQSGVMVEAYFADTVGGERSLMDFYCHELTGTEPPEGYYNYSGNMTGYINYVYRNTASADRTFNVHIYTLW